MKTTLLAALVAILSAVVFPAGAASVFTAVLDGPSESPPVASLGTGTARVTFDTVAHTMRVQASFSGLTGTTTVAHIHCCTALPFTSTIGVATTTPTFPGFPAGVTSGTYDATFDLTLAASFNAPFLTANGGTPAGAEAALFAGLHAGTAYFNIHSSFVGSGEIRGFLTPIPEPENYALMLAGLGLAGFVAARRKQSARRVA